MINIIKRIIIWLRAKYHDKYIYKGITILNRWDSKCGSWESVGRVNDIKGPSLPAYEVDLNPCEYWEAYREFINRDRDIGTISMKVELSPGSYEKMLDDFHKYGLISYKILLNYLGETELEFEAMITEIPIKYSMISDVVFKVSGSMELASGIDN